MAWNGIPVVDGDGHVMEDWMRSCIICLSRTLKAVASRGEFFRRSIICIPPVYFSLFPAHSAKFAKTAGSNSWKMSVSSAPCFTAPAGLAFGKVITREFAVDVARAWNNWFADTYLKKSPRFQGLALIPLQEPEEAVKEMRRAVTEIEFLRRHAAVHQFQRSSGRQRYWPVYAEANRLGCCIGVHGGAHEGLGMDSLTPYAPMKWGSGTSLRSDGGVRRFCFQWSFRQVPQHARRFHGSGCLVAANMFGKIRPRLGNPYPIRSTRRISPIEARAKKSATISAVILKRGESSSVAKAPKKLCITWSKPSAISPSCFRATFRMR